MNDNPNQANNQEPVAVKGAAANGFQHNLTLKKKIAFSLILFVIFLLFAAVFGEIFVRLFSPPRYAAPGTGETRTLQYEPSLFSRYVFAREPQTVIGWDDGKWHVNSLGYRGPDFTIDKPEGTIRILFYGGSTVFDSGSPEGKDWPRQVEHILRQKGFENVQVINAGIPGHASFDSFGRLFAEGHIFKPDYVVLYNAWNDIKYFRSNEPLLREFQPYVKANDFSRNYEGPVDRILCKNSQAYLKLRQTYYAWKYHADAEGIKPRGQYSSQIGQLGPKQYKLNLEMFVDLARNIGAVPILMTQARLVTPENSENQKIRINYKYTLLTHQALCDAFEMTDEIVYEVAKSKDVFVIDAARRLSGKDELFRDHVHLSEKGAEELANLTAGHIADLLNQTKAQSFVAFENPGEM